MRNLMIMEQYNNDINKNNHDRKKLIFSLGYMEDPLLL